MQENVRENFNSCFKICRVCYSAEGLKLTSLFEDKTKTEKFETITGIDVRKYLNFHSIPNFFDNISDLSIFCE